MTGQTKILERAWRLVETRGTIGTEGIAADPLELLVDGDAVMAGIDSAGGRHLLIPIPTVTTVTLGASGPAVTLVRRDLMFEGIQRTFVDLSCRRPDLFAEFASLCGEVVEAVRADPASAAVAPSKVLTTWRELLEKLTPPKLDRTRTIGLYAELRVLEDVLKLDPSRRVDVWTGPSRGRYDFQRGPVVLEVKGSTARRGRPIVIHGIDQLEQPPNASLYLCWMNLEAGVDRGESLRSVVDRLMDECANPGDLQMQLASVGYDFGAQELYDQPLLTELERRIYLVDSGFPSLTRANLIGGELPNRVIAVTYEVDLSGSSPAALDETQALEVLEALAGRS